MALDLRLQQKLAQQLVMTPQLQQAIKLLQLSHLEMADVLREEVEQNPVLEEERSESSDSDDEGSPELSDEVGALTGDDAAAVAEPRDRAETTADASASEIVTGSDIASDDLEIASDLPSILDAPVDATPEPTNQEVEREIDWEAYLESYSYSLPASAGSGLDSDDLPSYETTQSNPTSLADHLRWQVQMSQLTEQQRAIASVLIEELNDDGYLPADVDASIAEQLEIDVEAVSDVIREMQSFEPVGVAARSLRECLLIQLRHRSQEDELVYAIVDQHLAQVERRNYQAIAKALKVSLEAVGEAVKVIALLEPRPGRELTDKQPQYIVPDIFVHKVGDDFVIVLNEDGLPRLRISGYYRDALRGSAGQTKSYIQERLRSAAWLIRSIHMRQRTIYRVMESILKFQRDFFDSGVRHLRPLILKEVAEDVGMHESTISRVTTNKYVHTPQGIYELKYFFNSSINRVGGESVASESVRDGIKRLIDAEDPHSPLSDQKIVETLKGRDIDIARRTVAKYREMLKIPSSSRRRRVF